MQNKRIKKITIKKLFGMFDHEISLHTDENITILHGQNGVGKTTVLKMIDDLFSDKIFSLHRYFFESLRIDYIDGNHIIVEKEHQELDIKGSRTLIFKGSLLKKPVTVSEKDIDIGSGFPLGLIEECMPFLDRIGPKRWIDLRTRERLSLIDIVDTYHSELAHFGFDFKGSQINLESYEMIREALSSVKTHFIQTQRLFVKDEGVRSGASKHSQITIEKYAEDMADMIKDAVRNSGVRSASLDRTFPNRILSGSIPLNTDDKFIRNKYNEQNDYRVRLMNAGLIEEEEGENLLPEDELDQHALKVLWHYLSDVDDKFDIFKEILPKIELYMKIINSRFKYKKMYITKNDGFRFMSDIGQPIPLKSLSSGEQHELVLTYELIFKVPEKTLILIDEPELSLHVSWQQKFLSDLKKISELTKLDFIIATHSPSIVHGYRSLMEEIPTTLIEVINV